MVFIGKISYSLYLWHWPLYVFAKCHLPRELTSFEAAVLIALSASIAAPSRHYLDQPLSLRLAECPTSLMNIVGFARLTSLTTAPNGSQGVPHVVNRPTSNYINVAATFRQMKRTVY